jgi:nucleoside-diphosphate-sugar epimerase
MSDKCRVLVTGADGFVGRHLVPFLAGQGYTVVAASRAAALFEDANIISVKLPDLSSPFDWAPLLAQCDVVVHLAGIAHKFAVEDLYDRVNHQTTAALAHAAVTCGIKHLVFISSIAAQSGSFSDHELTETDPPKPNNAYGRSKLAAEKAVRASGIQFTILRPVVIYGTGEKGNFATIHKISRLPIPLPFGTLKARRSVLSIENFNSAVETALSNPLAYGETFIVADPTPVTVADLIARYRVSLGRTSLLVPIPEKWLAVCLKMTGQGAMWERLGCSLVASPNKFLAIGWNPTEPPSVCSPGP